MIQEVFMAFLWVIQSLGMCSFDGFLCWSHEAFSVGMGFDL